MPSSQGSASACAVSECWTKPSTPLPSAIEPTSRSKKTDSPPTMSMSAFSSRSRAPWPAPRRPAAARRGRRAGSPSRPPAAAGTPRARGRPRPARPSRRPSRSRPAASAFSFSPMPSASASAFARAPSASARSRASVASASARPAFSMTSASLSRTCTAASPAAAASAWMPSASRSLACASRSAAFSRASARVSSSAARWAGGLLGGLGGLDVLDQLLLRLGLGGDDDGLPAALGLLDGPQLLDGLLLLGDRPVHRDPLPDDLGDLAASRASTSLSSAICVSSVSRSRAMTSSSAVLLDALVLDGDDPLAVLLRRRRPRGPGSRAGRRAAPRCAGTRPARRSRSSSCDPRGLGLLAGPHGLDLAALLDLGVGLAALQLQDGLPGVDVLPGDLLLLGALELVGAHVLDRGQLGDLPDALGVEDVGRVELGQRRLLQEVDRRVLEVVAVEVGADDLDDLVPELLALGVEVDEVQLLADGLERLGELRVEQLLQRLLVAGPLRCRSAWATLMTSSTVLLTRTKNDDPDVGADVVLADQPLLAGPA